MRNKIESNLYSLECFLNKKLPPYYRHFLMEFGVADMVELNNSDGDSISWYGSEMLIERNETYAIQAADPALLMIGQDGDLGYFIDIDSGSDVLYSVDIGALGCIPLTREADNIQAYLNVVP